MTDYVIAEKGSEVKTYDTLNEAIGKLEARILDLEKGMQTIAKVLVDFNNRIPNPTSIEQVSGKDYNKLNF